MFEVNDVMLKFLCRICSTISTFAHQKQSEEVRKHRSQFILFVSLMIFRNWGNRRNDWRKGNKNTARHVAFRAQFLFQSPGNINVLRDEDGLHLGKDRVGLLPSLPKKSKYFHCFAPPFSNAKIKTWVPKMHFNSIRCKNQIQQKIAFQTTWTSNEFHSQTFGHVLAGFGPSLMWSSGRVPGCQTVPAQQRQLLDTQFKAKFISKCVKLANKLDNN
jgi:hypothetical protein